MGKAAALPYRVDVPKLDNLTDSMTWSQDAGGRKNDKNALDCPGLKCLIWQRKGRRFRSRKALADGLCVPVHARADEFARLLRGAGGFFDNIQNGLME